MCSICLCLRTENRSRKTHVFEYRDCGVEWGGVGGHVNVPCTSYLIYCHAAEISGMVYYVTCCYAADGVGWGGVGGMLTFLVLRAWYIAMLLRSLGSFTTLHVLMGWGGVGLGGVGGHVKVPCTSYMIYCHAAEISGIVYYVICCYAAEISGIVYYVTCCYAAEVSGIVYYVTCCYAAEISGIVYYVTCCYAAEISGTVYYVTCSMWNLMKKSIPSNLSAKSDLLMVYARAWQWRCIHKNADCQLITVHALQRWRWKAQKTRPKFFQDFQSSNQHGTVVKSPCF